MGFTETLDRHLAAIKDRDLAALKETLSDDRLTLITSDGRLVQAVQEFVAMHQDWFASPTWKLDAELVSKVEGSDVSVATLILTYQDEGNGKPIREKSYLTLVFQRQGNHWRMVHDQNTPVRPARS